MVVIDNGDAAESEYLLATAATNGAVIIWNLEREGYKNVQGGRGLVGVVLQSY